MCLPTRSLRQDLSGARRVVLHRRAAVAYEGLAPDRLEEAAGRLAEQYAAAGELAIAARYAEVAAERALAVAAPDEAVGFYERALALEATPARRLGLGLALFRRAEFERAREVLHEALGAFEAVGDAEGFARACVRIAEVEQAAGQLDEVAAWTERGLARLVDAAGTAHAAAQRWPELYTFARLEAASALLQGGRRLGEAERYLHEVERLAREHHLGRYLGVSRFGLGNVLAQRGELERAVQLFLEARDLAREAADAFHEALALNNAAHHTLLAGDLKAALAHADEGLAVVAHSRVEVPLQWLYSTRGDIALAQEAWDEADAWFARGAEIAMRLGNQGMITSYCAKRGLVARARGELAQAEGLLEDARKRADQGSDLHLQTRIDLWLAELHRDQGRDAQATSALDRAARRLCGHEGEQAWLKRRLDELRSVLLAGR
jgi:tetratricopeptide (TPR) repeat protein